jgi:MFS family permease
MVFLLINTIGIVLAGLVSHRWNKKRILFYTTMIAGLALLVTPFIPRLIFVVIYAILMIIGGFMLVNLISLVIDASQERITIYQTITVFTVLAKVILVPLGTGLSAFISTEWIIFLAGVFLLLGLIPLTYIKIQP